MIHIPEGAAQLSDTAVLRSAPPIEIRAKTNGSAITAARFGFATGRSADHFDAGEEVGDFDGRRFRRV